MEPALFGVQVTHGPDMRDFPDTERMDAYGAALKVRKTEELAEAWLDAVNPDARDQIKLACQKYFASVGGAGERSWNVIKNSLHAQDRD